MDERPRFDEQFANIIIVGFPTLIVPIRKQDQNHHYWEEEKGNTPLTTPCAAKNIAMVSALERIAFCPELRYAKEVRF